MKKYILLCAALLLTLCGFSQTISGNLIQLANQEIKLEGFKGLKNYHISSAQLDVKGNFKLTYSKADFGVGYLMSADEKPLFVILSGEDIELVGEAISYTETIKIRKGQENQWFEQYAQEHPRREQALSAWIYLEKIYAQDPLFSNKDIPNKAIQNEKARINKEDKSFLAQLPKDSYVSWFLPIISICDYKKWESPIAKDYYVFATPTMFLLNNKREILLRPNSVKQMDAWVDWVLVQGNE